MEKVSGPVQAAHFSDVSTFVEVNIYWGTPI